MSTTGTAGSVPASVMAGEGMKCNTCLAIFPNSDAIKQHYKGEWHIFNTKRRSQGLSVVRREQFAAFLQTPAGQAMIARKTLASVPVPTANNSSHRKTGSAVPVAPKPEVVENPEVVEKPAQESEEVEEENNEKDSKEDEEEEEEDDDWEDVDEDEETTPRRSLFDDRMFDSFDDALEYMISTYGFFLPDIEYLVDIEGLLTYLQEKVRLGNICLFCQKRFHSTAACQHHMVGKSHCKLAYDAESDEYEDFYDFSKSHEDVSKVVYDEDGNVVDEEVEQLSTGELRLPDGRVLGHRAFKVYYKQRPQYNNEHEAAVIHRRETLERFIHQFGESAVMAVTRGTAKNAEGSMELAKLNDMQVMTALVQYHKIQRQNLSIVQIQQNRQLAHVQRQEVKSAFNKRRGTETTTAKIRDYHGMLK